MKSESKTISRFLGTAFLLAGLIVFLLGCTSAGQKDMKDNRPNIVLIVADDLGYGDLSCYGAEKISTPVIDGLARDGMKFTDAYVVSSLCSPSRYSILTGRYSWRTRLKFGVLKYFERPLIEPGETTLASLLKRNGYYTACVGKWHLGLDWKVNENAPPDPEESVFNSWADNAQDYIDFSQSVGNGPTERGFDYFYGMAGSNNMQPYAHIEDDRVVEPPSIAQKPYDHYVNAPRAPNWNIKTINQDFTNKAVEVINNHCSQESGNPFFLYFPTSAIHRPCLPTFTKGKSEAGLRGDIVLELDWTVGEIIKALKKNGVYDHTLIIFTSDNGPRPGDPALWMERYEKGDYEDYHPAYLDQFHPEYVNESGNEIWKKGWFTYDHNASGDLLGFKSDAWDGGLKVPFIVCWPDHVEWGTVNPHMISTVDLLSTISELVGDSLSAGEGEDSYSFLSNILDRDAPQVRKSLTITGGASGAFVEIQEGWKYIEAATPGRWPETFYPDGPSKFDPQLYNLNHDVAEQDNLYGENPDKVSEMNARIEQVKNSPGIEAGPFNSK